MLGMVWKWLERLLRKRGKSPQGRRADWPTREEIMTLPPFEALGLDGVVEVVTPEAARRAYDELAGEEVLGFDTESKPTFVKGEVSTGPHVVQFATLRRAYVFVLHEPECRRAAGRLIASASTAKVGFGLDQDVRQVTRKLRVEPRRVVELGTLFAARGHGPGVGAKVGVAIALGRRLQKSKKTGTSNWSCRRLTDKQLLYAANDAFAAISVYHVLTK